MSRQINTAGLDLIKCFEGLKDGDSTTGNLDPYADPAGYWTIGWGHLIQAEGRSLRGAADRDQAYALYPGGITLDQATQLLSADLMDKCRDVERLVTAPVNDNQFAALVSFAYNCGSGNLKSSTLLKKVNSGTATQPEIAAEFVRWNQSGGVVLAGLTRRREAEAALYGTTSDNAPSPDLPPVSVSL